MSVSVDLTWQYSGQVLWSPCYADPDNRDSLSTLLTWSRGEHCNTSGVGLVFEVVSGMVNDDIQPLEGVSPEFLFGDYSCSLSFEGSHKAAMVCIFMAVTPMRQVHLSLDIWSISVR